MKSIPFSPGNVLLVFAFATATCVQEDPVSTEGDLAARAPAAATSHWATDPRSSDLMDRWVELMSTAELTIADEIFSGSFASHIPNYPDVTNLESYKVEVASAAAVIPEFHLTVEDLFFQDDRAVGRFTATGLMPPTMVPYTNTWIVVYRFEGGRIAEEWWQFDLLGVQQQLGVMPSTRDSYTWGEASEIMGDPGIPPRNESLGRRAEHMWNSGNLDQFEKVFDGEAVAHDPVFPEVITREDLRDHISMVRTAFPDLRVSVKDIIASGDRVAVRRRLSGTHVGDYLGIPGTGREVEYTGTEIYRIADGKIVESWWAFDALGLVIQLTSPE